MVREVAVITVAPGQADAFRAGFEKAVPVFNAAKGCKGVWIEQCIETPEVFNLHVLWETLEDHTVTFRNSDGFQQWRGLVGHTFASPPSVTHFHTEQAR